MKPTPRMRPPMLTGAEFELDQLLLEDAKSKPTTSNRPIVIDLTPKPNLLKPKKRRFIPPKLIQPTTGTIYELPFATLCGITEEFDFEYVHEPPTDRLRVLYRRFPNRRYYAFRSLPGSAGDDREYDPADDRANTPSRGPSAACSLVRRKLYETIMLFMREQPLVHGAPYFFTPELTPQELNDGDSPTEWLIVMMIEFLTHSKYRPEDVATWELFPEKRPKPNAKRKT